jgi:glutathione reductase (NADPH)
MFNAATVSEVVHHAKDFGFTVPEGTSFDWTKLKQFRDRYIARLNGIYESGLENLSIDRINGRASFEGPNTLVVRGTGHSHTESRKVTAEHICIAVGGEPNQLEVPGGEHVISSDGFFALESQPKKVGVVGGGYIAVELASVLHILGTDTSLIVRGDRALRSFDVTLSKHLNESFKKSGTF